MIKYEIEASQEPKLMCCGDKTILTADTLILVKMIYDSIRRNNPVEAEAYIHAIVAMLLDKNSPMWMEVENEQPEQSHGGKGD